MKRFITLILLDIGYLTIEDIKEYGRQVKAQDLGFNIFAYERKTRVMRWLFN